MPPKEAIAIRIPAVEMTVIKARCEAMGMRPQDYIKRLIHRHVLRLRRMEKKEQADANPA